jgi:hypothetical protein
LRTIAAGLGNPRELLDLAAELEAVRPGLGDASQALEPAPQPGPGAIGQTFVSAPAAGAIALVMGLAGVGTGYLIRGKLQGSKRRGRTSRKLADPSEDEE